MPCHKELYQQVARAYYKKRKKRKARPDKYDIGAAQVMPTDAAVPAVYSLVHQVAMAYYGPERYAIIYPKSSPPPPNTSRSVGIGVPTKKLESDAQGNRPSAWSVNHTPGTAPGKPPRNLWGEYDPKTVKYPKAKEGNYAIQQPAAPTAPQAKTPFEIDREQRAALRADIDAGLDIPEHRFGRHRDLADLAETRRRQRAFLGDYAIQKSLFDGPTGGATGDQIAPNWIRKEGERGATYWYNRLSNPNDRPEGRLYQTDPPTMAQARSTSQPKKPAPKPFLGKPIVDPPKAPEPEAETKSRLKQEQELVANLVKQGKPVPPALAKKHAEVVKSVTERKEQQKRMALEQERTKLRDDLEHSRKVDPSLLKKHPDIAKIVESERKLRVAQSAEQQAKSAVPRTKHEDKRQVKAVKGEVTPRSGHIGMTEYPGHNFKYTIENPNPGGIPEHHDALETRLVEDNNELFRVSIIGTSHGQVYSHIEIGDTVDSQPGKQTVHFRPATKQEATVIASKTDKQSAVAALERQMYSRAKKNWVSEVKKPAKVESLPGQRSLFTQAQAFADAICEKYAPRWTKPALGFRKKGRPSRGQKSFEFAADEHASILRQWDFQDEVNHPRGPHGKWVSKNLPEQTDKPAPLFEHEKIDDIASALSNGDTAAAVKSIGSDWIDQKQAKQIMGKMGFGEREQSQQISSLFHDPDTKRTSQTMLSKQFAIKVKPPRPKQDIDYDSIRSVFYDPNGRLRMYPARIKKVLGEHIDREQAVKTMKAVGADDQVIRSTLEEAFSEGDNQVESEWFGFQFFHNLGQHGKRKRWAEVSAQIPDEASVVVFAKEDDPYEEKLILHPSTYTKGTWQLSRRDKDGPVSHSDHKTREDGLRAAIGVAEHHLNNEGDERYNLLWHNKSGQPAPFSNRRAGFVPDLYSQLAHALLGPERYAGLPFFKRRLKSSPGQMNLPGMEGGSTDPAHHHKHPHKPAGPGGGQFAPKPGSQQAGAGQVATEDAPPPSGSPQQMRTEKLQTQVQSILEAIESGNIEKATDIFTSPKVQRPIKAIFNEIAHASHLHEDKQDDAFQETSLAVWQKLFDRESKGAYDPSKAKYAALVAQIARFKIKDQMRGKKADQEVPFSGIKDPYLDADEFETGISEREHHPAFSPEAWASAINDMFKIGANGFNKPWQKQAALLAFGYGTPDNEPMTQEEIGKELLVRQWRGGGMSEDDARRKLETTSPDEINRARKRVNSVLSKEHGTFWGLVRRLAEQGRITEEQLLSEPAQWLFDEAEKYAMLYMLNKYRHCYQDLLKRPERYLLAELRQQPERYTRPFDESKVVRGQKGAPDGGGGQFQSKHGAAPPGTQGVQAAQSPGSTTTPTPSAAPSVPKLLPSQKPQPTGGGFTPQAAVALAVLAAGALSGKRGMGAGLLAGAAGAHLTSTMRTQAKQARAVLKEDPESEFGKQLAESARKIDAQLKAAKQAKVKKSDMEQRAAEKAAKAAEQQAKKEVREAEQARNAAIRAQQAEIREAKTAKEKELLPTKLETAESRAKATQEKAKAAAHKASVAAMKAELAERLAPEHAETEKLKTAAKKSQAEAKHLRAGANKAAQEIRGEAAVTAAKTKKEDEASRAKVHKSSRQRREQTENLRKARAAARTGFIPRETPDVKAALDRLVGSNPVKRDLVRMKLEELYRSKADEISQHNAAIDELMGLGTEIPFVSYEGTTRERRGTRPRTRRDIQDEIENAMSPRDIAGFDQVVDQIKNQLDEMATGGGAVGSYPIIGISGQVGESSVDSLRDNLFAALKNRDSTPGRKQVLTGYMHLPRRSDEALLRDAIDHAGVDDPEIFDPDQAYHEEARDEFTGDAPRDIDEQAERERKILESKARKAAGESSFVEDLTNRTDESVDYDPWADDESEGDERGDAWEPESPAERNDDDAVPFTMKHHRATRNLYTQLAAAYYGGKVGNCLA
jgi:hypothetical protein